MVNRVIENRCYSLSILLTATVATALLFSASGESYAATDAEKPGCDYRQYLDTPEIKQQYLSMKGEMELIARIRSDKLARKDFPAAVVPDDNLRELDDHSKECISCHSQKGNSASDDINDPKHAGMLAISATHGIGTDYVAISVVRSNLRKVDELPSGMTLVNGRIACITCHNPLNPQPNSLAVESRGSTLCFACHLL